MAFNNVPINGWPQISADNIPFSADDFNAVNVKDAILEASSGGGGGGTTVVANPEGSATADLTKLQVGETIYSIPAEAGDISYDNTSSGMTADDVQEAIDELNTGLGGINALIPSDATTSNKLATAADIPDAVTGNPSGSATAGNLNKIEIGNDIFSLDNGNTYTTSELKVGSWLGSNLYRMVVDCGAVAQGTKYVSTGINQAITVRHAFAVAYASGYQMPLPFLADGYEFSIGFGFIPYSDNDHPNAVRLTCQAGQPNFTSVFAVIEYTKNS